MKLRYVLALLLAFALFTAACGDDDDDAGGADTATDDGTTEAPTEAPTEATEPATDDGGTDDVVAADTEGDNTAGDDTEEPKPSEFDVDAVLAADLNACAAVPTGDPLIIGYAADLSEVGGFADIPASAAAQHFVDLVNCAGGVLGTPVEFVVEDIQGDPEVTQRAAQDLLEAGVQAILGPPFADFGQPLLQTVGGQVPVLFVASTEPTLPDPAALSFLTTFDDTAQAKAAAQFAIDQGFTRAITFSSEGPYFGYNPEVFTEEFEALGGEVVLDQAYVPFEDFDFSAQANEVAGVADGTEILYTAMIADQVVALRGQLQELGVEIAYIGADAFEVTGIGAVENNDGIYYTTHAFAEPGGRLATFLASFEAATGAPSEAPSFAGLAADAIIVAIEGFLAAGADPVAMGEAIAAIESLETVTGTTGYAGTAGVPNKPVYVHQWLAGAATLAATIGG